jgi:hypothetical protein
VAQAAAPAGKLELKRPPGPGEKPWFDKDYSDPIRVKDRELFA